MSFEITIGYWLIPTLITFFVISCLIIWEIKQPPAYGYGAIVNGMVSLIVWMGFLFIPLLAWLIYFIVM